MGFSKPSPDANDPNEDLGFDAGYDVDAGYLGLKNPWADRARLIPTTVDGLEFELEVLPGHLPMPEGMVNHYFLMPGTDGLYFGKDDNGRDYLQSIKKSGFSGFYHLIDRDADPDNGEFSHLSGLGSQPYDHNDGNLDNELRDYLDGLDHPDEGPTDDEANGHWRFN